MSPVIVVFVDERYVPIAVNWLAAVKQIGLERNVVLVTLDPVAEQVFAPLHAARLFRPLGSQNLGDLWIHRIRILAALLADGRDIVHSDADAVWLGNPLDDLFSPGFDMVFSQGTFWPPDVHERRGVVVCCGLFAVRSSPRTRAVFAELERRVAAVHDDQVVMNQLLDETVGPWTVESSTRMKTSGKTYTVSTSMMVAEGDRLKVGLVPFHKYPRIMSGPQGVVVGHPLSGKTAAETEDTLRRCGLWVAESSPRMIAP